MKMKRPLSGIIWMGWIWMGCSWMGCMDGTKLPNNDVADSSEFVDIMTKEDHAETTVLFSVDSTFGQISQINPLDGITVSIQPVSVNHQISSMSFNELGVAYIYDHLSRKLVYWITVLVRLHSFRKQTKTSLSAESLLHQMALCMD